MLTAVSDIDHLMYPRERRWISEVSRFFFQIAENQRGRKTSKPFVADAIEIAGTFGRRALTALYIAAGD
jgi:hypothetical protein